MSETTSTEKPGSRLLRPFAIGYAIALGFVVLFAILAGHQPGPSTIERAEHEISAHQFADARRDAERALREHPKDAAIVTRVIAVALAAGDDDLAKVALYAKIADAPRDYSAHVLLSEINLREHNRPMAEEELRTAIRLAPDAPYLHYHLGRMQLADGKDTLAAATLRGEPSASPDYPAARRDAANALARAAAIRHARARAAQLALENRRHRHGRGKGHHAHKGAKVIAHRPRAFVAAAHVGPRRGGVPSGLSSEARAYLLAMSLDFNFTHALPHADSYRNLSSGSFSRQLKMQLRDRRPNVTLLLRMGSSALESGDIDSAMDAFRVASRVAKHDWRGPYLYGLTLQAVNRYDQAARFYRAAERRSARPEPLTSLALLEFRLGNLNAAERYARSAANLDPSYSPGRFMTGMLALLHNDRWRAEDELSATTTLAWPPQRAAYFLNRLNAQSRVGATVARDL